MNSAVFWTALCFAPSSVLGDQGTNISSSVFCFKVLRVKSRNLFLYYHFVILYVQHKGSHSLPLDATCNEHGVTLAQNLKEWENEESGGLFKDLRQNFLDSGCGFTCAVYQSPIPFHPCSPPSASWSTVSTVTQSVMDSGCGDITKSGSL